MSRSGGRQQSFPSFPTLTLAFLLLSASAVAQTAATRTDATSPAPAAATKAEAAPAPETTPSPEAAPAVAAPAPAEASNVEKDSAKPEAAPAAEAAAPAPSPGPSPSASPGPSPTPAAAAAQQLCTAANTIDVEVIALAQPYLLNRMGASMPHAVIYALAHDVSPFPAPATGYVTNDLKLQSWKRARPIVLRANQGDCLKINLTNLINTNAGGSSTGPVSLHAQGMQAVNSIADDGSYVGANATSLADPLKSKTYTLYAQQEGTFLLYSEGDTNTMGQQLQHGLFGAVNVQPAGAEWYRSQVTREDMALATIRRTAPTSPGNPPGGQPVINYAARYPANYKDAARACAPILQMAAAEQEVVTVNGVKQCQPKAGGSPRRLYHSDLTAIITGPNAGRFPGTTGVGRPEPACNRAGQPGVNVNPLFCTNPASPDRKQPYREVTVIYHEVTVAVQAFPIFKSGNVQDPANPNDPTKQIPNPAIATTIAGQDLFAINYGTGGIGAEIYGNRIGVGPMANCVDCKFEEFFLTSWAVGDPAMVVDVPANYFVPSPTPSPTPPPCNPNTIKTTDSANNCLIEATRPLVQPITTPPPPQKKATKAFYPDDPSNVYHSYLNDHVKFRILHGGTGVTHVHHQHAHQWLQSPNSSEGSYLDSQFISPGASYTLEMVYNGSGNRNKTLGDSIFHCHFYPHFAAGMWSMWRVHDVFEDGTALDSDGRPLKGARAYPDAEILAGTPIPALVPVPTLPMPLMPSPVFIDNGQIVFGTPLAPDTTGQNVKTNPGYPFFIPGVAGFRPPHPPLDFAPDGAGGFLDGGLPRHVNTGGTVKDQLDFTTDVNNWSKEFVTLNTNQLPEAGTNVEKVAIAFNDKRCNPTYMPDGTLANSFGPANYPECGAAASQAQFIVNGLPNGPQLGAPFADPAVDDQGKAVGKKRLYKAAAIQSDVRFNEKGWHYQQQRLLTLWQDVQPTLNGTRKPEPFFFRANSQDDFIEYWHTNLVPNYYEFDNFQVRTPTDILGQHIHLVKFDVTSSDGAANGWNYEDGTYSPLEVQEAIHAINAAGGINTVGGGKQNLTPKPPPAEIFNCAANPNDARCKPCPPHVEGQPHNLQTQCKSWLGAQTTVQRWYADPFFDNDGQDNTVRTVFTHDHFGPSTHQQAGLYAGLLVEPKGSKWFTVDGQDELGKSTPAKPRTDGGPTSWQANIIAG
ncbi:MAG TPA: multicopper oxidase domain-containing protein, partial [Pyrinomonadaceae bacterium]